MQVPVVQRPGQRPFKPTIRVRSPAGIRVLTLLMTTIYRVAAQHLAVHDPEPEPTFRDPPRNTSGQSCASDAQRRRQRAVVVRVRVVRTQAQQRDAAYRSRHRSSRAGVSRNVAVQLHADASLRNPGLISGRGSSLFATLHKSIAVALERRLTPRIGLSPCENGRATAGVYGAVLGRVCAERVRGPTGSEAATAAPFAPIFRTADRSPGRGRRPVRCR